MAISHWQRRRKRTERGATWYSHLFQRYSDAFRQHKIARLSGPGTHTVSTRYSDAFRYQTISPEWTSKIARVVIAGQGTHVENAFRYPKASSKWQGTSILSEGTRMRSDSQPFPKVLRHVCLAVTTRRADATKLSAVCDNGNFQKIP